VVDWAEVMVVCVNIAVGSIDCMNVI
jgi:hypothetical protein